MKKLLFLSGCLWALGSSSVMAQTGTPAVAVVQVSYGATTFNGGTSYIVISRGTGSAEKIEYKGYLKDNSLEPDTLQRVLTKLYAEGYSLKSTYAATYRPTTFILVKEK